MNSAAAVAIIGLVIIIAAIVIIKNTAAKKRTFDKLGRMLDDAYDGRFVPDEYDESRLSTLESRFHRYISMSAVSAGRTEAEHEHIKSLISDISHQTKTPIANLVLYSDLALEKELPDDARSDIEAIKRQSETLRFLIDSLVKLSRLENGIITLSPEHTPLTPIFAELQAQFAGRASDKGMSLIINDSDISAVFDPGWTREALSNIIDNAVKYTESGSITITAIPYEMFVRIDISDTGIGISEDDTARIFSRFYRAEAAKCEEGSGLGLYLARELITREGGYIKVSSAIGGGSTFSVFLPR